MKTMITAALFAVGLAGGALADPVLGVWKTEVDDGAYAHVKFAPCGPNFCGKIVRTFNAEGEYKSPNLGKTLFIDMTPDGNGKYSGSAWRPANGKIYKGSMTLKGNKLKAGGCVAGIICIKNTLTRIK
ncbi:DUF2147 domain-containing protein [Sulfitobacter mediterraneus]|uniref:Imidazoleglycerol-phosphate dehydratase n=1 Tax=Sulfitobacter mediterraneus TaxID=83219 RepID=A0A061SLW5_9RHOB|nr:DUF2147 domain-containing protein [Sulfitobacter mediterraneus]KAJ01862.1 imidazoleglycerol-phosphate dehydratase [Sulfitobacter mediterraneus]